MKPLIEISTYFLKLGFLGFGGPLALMAAFQKDLVEKKQWTTNERFSHGLALIKALPGPLATQIAVYLGQIRGGRLGGFLAGFFLILPSFVMMVILASFYSTVEALSWSQPLLAGMQAAALGVILDSLVRLAKPIAKERHFWALFLISAVLMGVNPSLEPVAILASGLMGVSLTRFKTKSVQGFLFPLAWAGDVAGNVVTVAPSLAHSAYWDLLKLCLKSGALVFGTGLAIVPMLAHEVIDKYHWLTERQFMDALAFGQITPGPVLITVTFIGYKVGALKGALLGTVGVFAPAFFNILSWFPFVEKRFAGSTYAKSFASWALSAVVGSIAFTAAKLGYVNLHGPFSIGIGLSAFLLAAKSPIPVWILIPMGGAVQMAWQMLGPQYL